MICLTLKEGGVEPGIEISRENYAHVELGMPGPHTRQTWFGLATEFADWHQGDRLDRAFVIRTRRRGSLLIVEQRDPDDFALVKLDIPPGDGGTVAYTSPTYREEPCPVRGNEERLPVEANPPVPGTDHVQCGACGEWGVAEQVAPGGWVHPAAGTHRVYDPLARGLSFTEDAPPGTMTVLAEGTLPIPGAPEGPGRVYQQMVAALNTGAAFRVSRTGDLGNPEDRPGGLWYERIYRWTGEVLEEEDPFAKKKLGGAER